MGVLLSGGVEGPMSRIRAGGFACVQGEMAKPRVWGVVRLLGRVEFTEGFLSR